MNGYKIASIMEQLYPKNLAYDWDNVGLQIGTLKNEVQGVLISLDVTQEIVDEAIKNNCNFIIAHHPHLFSPVKTIKTDTPIGKVIELLIKHDITLYIAHTNFDISNYGMDYMLATMLDLKDLQNLDQVTDNEGLGKIGTIKKQSMKEFIDHVKTVFKIDDGRFIGDLDTSVERVAISGGSGSSNMFNAAHKKADLFITGDVSYHKALECKAIGLNTLDIGHYIESNFKDYLKDVLINEGVDVPIVVSSINTNPYKFI